MDSIEYQPSERLPIIKVECGSEDVDATPSTDATDGNRDSSFVDTTLQSTSFPPRSTKSFIPIVSLSPTKPYTTFETTSSDSKSNFSVIGVGEAAASKRELIRQKVRDRERRLSALVMNRSINICQNLALEQGQTTKDLEDPAKEASLKVLSETASSLTQRLNKKDEETRTLQKKIEQLESSLEARDKERMELNEEIYQLRKAMEESRDHSLSNQTDKALARSLRIESTVQKQIAQELQEKLTDSYDVIVWTQNESISKAEQLEYFEYELLARNKEIDEMRQELNEKLKRIIELEVDIETHDDRFVYSIDEHLRLETSSSECTSRGEQPSEAFHSSLSNMDAHPKKKKFGGIAKLLRLGKKTSTKDLDNSSVGPCDGTNTIHFDKTSSETSTPSNSPEQYIRTIQRLQADLDSLNTRYKRDRYQSKINIEQLRTENNEYLVKVLSLENSLQRAQDVEDGSPNNEAGTMKMACIQGDTDSSSDGDKWETKASSFRFSDQASTTAVRFLEEKLAALEHMRQLQEQTIENLTQGIVRVEKMALQQARQDKLALDSLRLENEAKTVRIASLEHGFRDKTATGGEGFACKLSSDLERTLKEQTSEILRLQREADVKNRKIDTLRSEIVELRMGKLLGLKNGATTQHSPTRDSDLESIDEECNGANEREMDAIQKTIALSECQTSFERKGSDRRIHPKLLIER